MISTKKLFKTRKEIQKPCFIPCLVIARRKRTVVTLDMFNFSSGLFISFRFASFRFAKYSNSRLKIGQNTLSWSSSLSII